MKSLIYVFLSINYLSTAYTQDSTFNKIYSSEYGLPDFTDIIVHNDTIVGIGTGYYELSENQGSTQGLIVARFDSSGQQIDLKILKDPQEGVYGSTLQYGRITKLSGEGYLLTTLNDVNIGGTVIKLDNDLQTVWTHTYADTSFALPIGFQDPVEIQGGYILYGSTPQYNDLSEPVIYRIDEAGNVIWFNYYGNPEVSDRYWGTLHLLDDNTFAVGGVGDGDEGSFIHIIDMDGNLIDSWYPGFNSEVGFLRYLQMTEDGDFIVCGERIIETDGSTYIMQHVMSRVSRDFEVKWSFPFGQVANASARVDIWDIEPTSDGNFIAAGRSLKHDVLPYSRWAGWLFKFTPHGDSLWTHLIDPLPAESVESMSSFYGGVGELSSGSYVAGGRANTDDYYMWLTKVTRDGCLADFCPDLNIVSTEAPPLPRQAGPQVVPNPGSGPFRLSWPEGEAPVQPVQVVVREVSGQPVWQGTIGAETEIPLGGLPAGVYFVEVKTSKARWLKKIVKY